MEAGARIAVARYSLDKDSATRTETTENTNVTAATIHLPRQTRVNNSRRSISLPGDVPATKASSRCNLVRTSVSELTDSELIRLSLRNHRPAGAFDRTELTSPLQRPNRR